ncbi:hypothetical protein [Amycolatopsis sp. lyj-108]|uniref:hypothetical protein n=1 Tax=Amycolatopsis sp. lyj-108 TaxID=2789286 RepID=UPI00397A8FFA
MLNTDKWRQIACAAKKLRKRTAALWRKNTAEILATGGASAITTGAAAIYGPAGWITGGVLAVIGAVCAAKSKGGAA